MKQLRRFSLLVSILQLSSVLLLTEQVKVSIKSHVGDWCIQAKGSRRVIIEKCFWKVNTGNGEAREKEQTFDVHPTDIEEQPGLQNDGGGPSTTSFLIRLSRSQQKSNARVATSCLSSISSNLTVEKCQLRKSRFRISGQCLTISHSSLCIRKTHHHSSNIRYKIFSSDQSCLELVNSNSTKVTFSKCDSEKVKQFVPTHLWQFCDKTGNCSLSPAELKWSSLIKVESLGLDNSLCMNDKALTTNTTKSPGSFQDDAETMTATTEPVETSSNNKNGSYDCNLGNMRNFGSWPISCLLFVYVPTMFLFH